MIKLLLGREIVLKHPLPSQSMLIEMFVYEPDTGILKWRIAIAHRCRVGERAGAPTINGRWGVQIFGHKYNVSQIAWKIMTGEDAEDFVDHRNGDHSDDRWDNLRKATPSQNQFNRKTQTNNTSGMTGVGKDFRGNGWDAYITVNKKRVYVARHVSYEEAVTARINAEKEYYGSYISYERGGE